jgi:hypothetical protein
MDPYESEPSYPVSLVLFIGFFGFVTQLPWAIILVYLPYFETVCGGVTFSFAMSIFNSAASNIIRLLMIFFSRRIRLMVRVITGAALSLIAASAYMTLFAVCDRSDLGMSPSEAVRSVGFWLGLASAFVSGASNAQLMSTGYGLASTVSQHRPVANSLFFAGQSVATVICWPIKLLIESANDDPVVRVLGVMSASVLLSLSLIPVTHSRIQPFLPPPAKDQPQVTLSDAGRVLRHTWLPGLILWVTYFVTMLVIPGQVMQWAPVVSEGYMSDSKSYRSLCVYAYLIADASSKFLPILISASPDRMRSFLSSRIGPPTIGLLCFGRLVIVPFFIYPPAGIITRFVVLVTFGLTCGLSASLSLSLSTLQAPDKDKDLAGFLSSFLIINGLFFGSLTGILIRAIL